jgi:signal transduction histidine kinase
VPIEGDDLRLEQVIQNLLQNAVKYSPEGGPIEVKVAREGEYAVIAVTDHGIGIPAASQPQLFQRFFRAGNVDASNISGMGIGLYVVKEIVSRHGGDVRVSSVEHQGTTFTVRLPLAAGASHEPLGESSGDEGGNAQRPSSTSVTITSVA